MPSERLTTAIRLLKQKLKNNSHDNIKIDMRDWGHHSGPHAPEEQNFCGTTACALGYLCLQPEMQALGMCAKWMWGDTLAIMDDRNDLREMTNAGKFFSISTRTAHLAFLCSDSLAECISALESAQ